MRQQMHDFFNELFVKGIPAAVAGIASAVTADAIYKWLGIVWLLLLIVDKFMPNIWARLVARIRGVPYEPPQK